MSNDHLLHYIGSMLPKEQLVLEIGDILIIVEYPMPKYPPYHYGCRCYVLPNNEDRRFLIIGGIMILSD